MQFKYHTTFHSRGSPLNQPQVWECESDNTCKVSEQVPTRICLVRKECHRLIKKTSNSLYLCYLKHVSWIKQYWNSKDHISGCTNPTQMKQRKVEKVSTASWTHIQKRPTYEYIMYKILTSTENCKSSLVLTTGLNSTWAAAMHIRRC